MHIHLNKLVVIFALIFSFAGCATTPIMTTMNPTIESKRIFSKNYEIGQTQKVNVGEEIIKMKDYWAKTTTSNKMKSMNDFILKSYHRDFHSGQQDNIFNIIGTIKHKGEKLYIIKIPGTRDSYGVSETGEWGYVWYSANKAGESSIPLIPHNTRFELIKETQIDASQGFINFEIIFTGITHNAINLLYREYTSDNLAKPAYYQSLTYPIDAEFMRFKKIQIKIIELTNESIKYIILDDGLIDTARRID